MEETNPWLDPDCGKHKNKKSVKPKPVIVDSVIESDKETVSDKVKVPNSDDDFLTTLVENGLDINLPKHVEAWAIENFDREWLTEFLNDVQNLKYDILESDKYPSPEKMILLKFLFLFRQV